MFHWRVTKYDPRWRDERGVYRHGEWTAATDIGTQIAGMVVEIGDYLAIEDRYVAAVLAFMRAADLDSLVIEALELGSMDQDELVELGLEPIAIDVDTLRIDQDVASDLVADVCRLALRSVIWCKLTGHDGFHVHFGHDYYMYVGTPRPSKDAILAIKASGLFVERKRSPYLTGLANEDA